VHAAKPDPDTEVPQQVLRIVYLMISFLKRPKRFTRSFGLYLAAVWLDHCVKWKELVLIRKFFFACAIFNLRAKHTLISNLNSFRLFNEQEQVVYAKFIWKTMQGLNNFVWDQAQKISRKNLDYHHVDLYTAIDNGDYPEWEVGVQIIQPQDENKFDFDLLDPTNIIPESIVPVTKLGKVTLKRNVDYYFGEVEQVTFHSRHVVRGKAKLLCNY
jgi:hypothetical protein